MADPFDSFKNFQWNLDALAEIFDATQCAQEAPNNDQTLLIFGQHQPAELTPKVLKTFFKHLQWDEFTLRQRLLAKMPRPIMKFPTHSAGVKSETEFHEVGINCFLIAEKDLFEYEKIPAVLLEITEESLTIQPMVGNKKTLPFSELLCAASATVAFRSQTSKSTSGLIKTTHSRSLDFPQHFRVMDLHLINQKRLYRFQEEQLISVFEKQQMTIINRNGGASLIHHLSSLLPYFPHFCGFNGNAQHLSNSLKVVSQRKNAVSPSVGKLAHQLETQTHEEIDERPLFDLYSVLSRYDLVLGNALA